MIVLEPFAVCPRRRAARSGPTTPWTASGARSAAAHLVGAVLAKWGDESAGAASRYVSLEVIAYLTPELIPYGYAADVVDDRKVVLFEGNASHGSVL